MKLDGYYDTKNEEETKVKAKQHLKEPKTCKIITKIIERTLLLQKGKEMMTLEEMAQLVPKAQFKRQGHDLIV